MRLIDIMRLCLRTVKSGRACTALAIFTSAFCCCTALIITSFDCSWMLYLSFILILLSGTGTMCSMLLLISEGAHDIGIMNFLGCSVRDIRTMFIIYSLILGFVGAIIGCFVAFVASTFVNFVCVPSIANDGFFAAVCSTHRISVISASQYFFYFIMTILSGLAAGILPARKAGKITVCNTSNSK